MKRKTFEYARRIICSGTPSKGHLIAKAYIFMD